MFSYSDDLNPRFVSLAVSGHAVDAGQYGAIQHLHRVETVRRVGERLLDWDTDFCLLFGLGVWRADRAPLDHTGWTRSRVRDRSDLVDLRGALSKFV